MQGKSVSIPTGSSALSAIDTGTTLIGGPSDAVGAIWDAVEGSQALTGQMAGFFAFRECLVYSYPRYSCLAAAPRSPAPAQLTRHRHPACFCAAQRATHR